MLSSMTPARYPARCVAIGKAWAIARTLTFWRRNDDHAHTSGPSRAKARPCRADTAFSHCFALVLSASGAVSPPAGSSVRDRQAGRADGIQHRASPCNTMFRMPLLQERTRRENGGHRQPIPGRAACYSWRLLDNSASAYQPFPLFLVSFACVRTGNNASRGKIWPTWYSWAPVAMTP